MQILTPHCERLGSYTTLPPLHSLYPTACTDITDVPTPPTPCAQVTIDVKYTATAPGTVGSVLVKDGDTVVVGQPVARVEQVRTGPG